MPYMVPKKVYSASKWQRRLPNLTILANGENYFATRKGGLIFFYMKRDWLPEKKDKSCKTFQIKRKVKLPKKRMMGN